MEPAVILRPLLEKGELKQSVERAQRARYVLYEVQDQGLNFVTASVLADVSAVEKMGLIRRTGKLFSDQEYCDLLNQKVFTVHPDMRGSLKEQGVAFASVEARAYGHWYGIFEVAFPWLPLSVFEDFVLYLRDTKSLSLDEQTAAAVKESFLACRDRKSVV